MNDQNKDRAETVARMVDADLSYLIGPWWTDRYAAFKIGEDAPDLLSAALNVECGCGQRGCDCSCEACSNCYEGDPFCLDAWLCPRIKKTWSHPQPEDTPSVPTHGLHKILEQAIAKPGDIVKVDRARGSLPRCVRNSDGEHTAGSTVNLRGVHVAAKYVVAGRRLARVTTWRFSVERSTLAGYRNDDLVAIVMPLGGGQCREIRQVAS